MSGLIPMTKSMAILALILFGMLPASRAISLEPGIYNELHGLSLKDEFDRIISSAFGCPDQIYKKRIEDLNKREGTNLKPPGCRRTVGALRKLLSRIHDEGGRIEQYLEARQGSCQQRIEHVHCVVVRDVVTHSHTGNPTEAAKFRDIFTVDVWLPLGDGPPMEVKLTRESLWPGEEKL